MKSIINTPVRYSLTLLILALFVSGCSSSSDPSPSNVQSAGELVEISGGNVDDDANSGVLETPDGSAADAPSDTAGESTDGADDTESDTATGLIDGTDDSRSTTRVNFDITVPVYASNALQVRLIWGDIDTNAMWSNDELWTASLDFPANTTNQLVVTFNDDNGTIALGTVEANYTTGTNVSESYQITADMFDTRRWDNDGDGVSNLDELLTGSNPVVANDLLDTEPVALNSVDNIAMIFDIVGGRAVDVMSNAVHTLNTSIDESAYPLLSTAPSGTSTSLNLYSDTHTYGCPVSGTISRKSYTQEGYGFGTELEADSCTSANQIMDGFFQFGTRWVPDEQEFTSSHGATISLNNGAYYLEAVQLHQQLEPVTVSYPIAYYTGTDISVSKHGNFIYSVGSLLVSEKNGSFLSSTISFSSIVSDIVTSAIDIDEIDGNNLSGVRGVAFYKSEGAEYYTRGNIVGSNEGVDVLVVNADTGDEATFSATTTSGDSTISEIYDWTPELQFGSYPLPD